tara:strand:+ start:544 stop:648 length:105 start_codon:yes stop_codon:yes gene_type:complete
MWKEKDVVMLAYWQEQHLYILSDEEINIKLIEKS